VPTDFAILILRDSDEKSDPDILLYLAQKGRAGHNRGCWLLSWLFPRLPNDGHVNNLFLAISVPLSRKAFLIVVFFLFLKLRLAYNGKAIQMKETGFNSFWQQC